MALRKNGKTTPTLAELRAQRQDLAGRLAALAGAAARLDVVNDWQILATQLAEQSALERAIAQLDERIEAAQLAERSANREAQDAERAARAVAAQRQMDDAARRLVDALERLPLAELDAAQRELGACAGWPSPAAGVVIALAGTVAQSKERLRSVAPTWVGLPATDKRALALAEAETALKRANGRLAAGKKILAAQRNDAQGPTITTDRMAELVAGVDIAQRRLAELA